MPTRGVAANCSSLAGDGINSFTFPSNPVLWIKEVKRMCDGWRGPLKHSVLCEKHFTADSFVPGTAIAPSIRLIKLKRVRTEDIPIVSRVCHMLHNTLYIKAYLLLVQIHTCLEVMQFHWHNTVFINQYIIIQDKMSAVRKHQSRFTSQS